MRLAAALLAALSIFTSQPARAATANEILRLAREVCLAHGTSLPRVEAIARERRWRELTVSELTAARAPNDTGYMTGWSVRDGEDQIALTISLPMWTFTTAMRRRLSRGSAVLAPPEDSLRMFGDRPPDFPRFAQMQICELRFSADSAEGMTIAANTAQLPFLGETFGDPASGPDGIPVNGLAMPDGGRWWLWSRHRDPTWQQIRLTLKPEGMSSFWVNQNWTE